MDALSGLTALQELRLSGNPLVEGAEGEARAEVKQRPQSCARHYMRLMYTKNGVGDRDVTHQIHLQVKGLCIGIDRVPSKHMLPFLPCFSSASDTAAHAMNPKCINTIQVSSN